MMITKLIEIRDRGTCIPALAMRMEPADEVEEAFNRRVGYPSNSIVLMLYSGQQATSDPYDWGKFGYGGRTVPNVHHYLYNLTHEKFDNLKNGQVIDVRVILEEQEEPARAEIWRGRE